MKTMVNRHIIFVSAAKRQTRRFYLKAEITDNRKRAEQPPFFKLRPVLSQLSMNFTSIKLCVVILPLFMRSVNPRQKIGRRKVAFSEPYCINSNQKT